MHKTFLRLALSALLAAALAAPGATADDKLLNVSYDPTRELYDDFNVAFAAHWKEKTGNELKVEQSHGGSGKQARAVIDGLEADVVTLALAHDITEIQAKTGLLPADWQSRLPNNSSPYTSTIVFLVRKGNPKGLHDWPDLVKDGVEVITPNPKTGGVSRYNYLAAWASVIKTELGGFDKLNDPAHAAATKAADAKALAFVTELYKHVPVLDSGSRGSLGTFAQREIGDVLLTWENEAHLAVNDLGGDKFEIVYPPFSLLAEPPVAWLDKNVEKHGTAELAKAYLEYLYSADGQRIAAKHYYRPSKPELADPADLARFPKLDLVSIDDAFGGWPKAQARHFVDGALFDQIYVPAAGTPAAK